MHSQTGYDTSGRPTRSSAAHGAGDTDNSPLADSSYCYAAHSAAPACTYRYAPGSLYDRTTGMLKYGQRWYQPTTGRFTQQDNLTHLADPSQGNRYAYAGNDPINNTDPTGAGIGDILAYAAGAIGFVGGVVALTAAAPEIIVVGVTVSIFFGGTSLIIGGVCLVADELSDGCGSCSCSAWQGLWQRQQVVAKGIVLARTRGPVAEGPTTERVDAPARKTSAAHAPGASGSSDSHACRQAAAAAIGERCGQGLIVLANTLAVLGLVAGGVALSG